MHSSELQSLARRQDIIRNKGIGLAFVTELACGTMARDKSHIIAQGPEFLGDRIDQVLMISPRKVGSAYGPLKQYIADHRQP